MSDGPAGRQERADSGEASATCPFCSEAFRAEAIEHLGTVFAVPDAQPVSPGHVLVVPVRHTADYFTMTGRERADADRLLRRLRERMMRQDPQITGFNVGSNCGSSAGQHILHAHVHLIPRREGDGNGRGVKGVVRNRFAY